MFDKDKFSELLINARGDRNNKQYAEDSGVSRAYVSGYINKSIDNPPTPDVIKRLANSAQNKVTYEELMKAAGHISINLFDGVGGLTKLTSTFMNNAFENNLTKKDEKDISKILEQTKEQLENSEGLMFDGEPASQEAIESILQAMEMGMALAKQKNKAKYAPKKYRKDNK
jgi:Helix-turn-helix.